MFCLSRGNKKGYMNFSITLNFFRIPSCCKGKQHILKPLHFRFTCSEYKIKIGINCVYIYMRITISNEIKQGLTHNLAILQTIWVCSHVNDSSKMWSSGFLRVLHKERALKCLHLCQTQGISISCQNLHFSHCKIRAYTLNFINKIRWNSTLFMLCDVKCFLVFFTFILWHKW